MGRKTVGVNINRPLLREIRLLKGLTQEDVADQVGYVASRISQIEIGHPSKIPLESLMRVAEFLEIDYRILLEEE